MNGNADQELQHHLQSINEITNSTTTTTTKHVVENCDAGWGVDHSSISRNTVDVTANVVAANNSSIKDSYKADLFEEDDLGFDPFHETQKALAEMLESESKQQQQQQQQQSPPNFSNATSQQQIVTNVIHQSNNSSQHQNSNT